MDKPRTWRIYKITCIATDKSYIGLTRCTIRQRWNNHVSNAVKGRTKMLFHKAIRKYGRHAFSVETLCEVATRGEASDLEQTMIGRYGTLAPDGYNLAAGGMGTPGVRRPHSEETKRKIAAGNRGRNPSAATRELMGAAKRGIPLPAAHRAKLSAARAGIILSESHKANIAAGHRGNTYPARSVALLKLPYAGGHPSTTGYRGVIPEGRRWTARIGINGRRVHLGVFDTPEEAHAAYERAVAARIAELEAAQNTAPEARAI
jgi:group I intron endonuclease